MSHIPVPAFAVSKNVEKCKNELLHAITPYKETLGIQTFEEVLNVYNFDGSIVYRSASFWDCCKSGQVAQQAGVAYFEMYPLYLNRPEEVPHTCRVLNHFRTMYEMSAYQQEDTRNRHRDAYEQEELERKYGTCKNWPQKYVKTGVHIYKPGGKDDLPGFSLVVQGTFQEEEENLPSKDKRMMAHNIHIFKGKEMTMQDAARRLTNLSSFIPVSQMFKNPKATCRQIIKDLLKAFSRMCSKPLRLQMEASVNSEAGIDLDASEIEAAGASYAASADLEPYTTETILEDFSCPRRTDCGSSSAASEDLDPYDMLITKPPPSTPATCDPKKPLKLLTKNCILEKGKLMVVFMDAYEKVTRRDMEEGTDSVVDDIRHERLDELVCDGYNQVYESRYREQVAMVSEEMKVFPCTYSPTIVHPRPLRQQLTRPTYAEYYKFEEYCTEMRGYRVRGLNAVEKYEEKLHGGRPWEVAEKKKRKRRKRVKSSAFDSVLKVPSPDLPSSDDQDAGAPPAAVDPA